ncbi:protein kinase, putative [Bodo saltans]|uniref:Protein kinase, putative n=1 Tax=Bodo saltans TaxID=75058 RepID=A0A0S4J595_BODSA|nr:protein kinase, putative [Bodo saltans]|eukprot:CUG86584.1 protein kinase, putative [Bodo saltans]
MSRGKIVGEGSGQYRIGEVLGKGAFSTVYICTRLIDQEVFAVKVLSKNDMRRDAELEDALCREFNSMEVIRRSPFITNMVEKLVSPRNYYIVMDLAKGGPLMHVIQQSRLGLHPNRARLYFRQLLMGLTAMHDSNVVHRDIKPENLLLDETKTVLKISDFGFACFSAPSRELFRRCGTLRYTAPEFYTEESYHGRAVDLWAAGVTLYVMLFNQYPFGRHGDTDSMIMDRIRKQEVQFPRKVSGSLEHLMRVMLRKDPAKRWTLEKVKSHAWVMGIDEFTMTIPRTTKKPTTSAAPKKNVTKVPPRMAGSAGSSEESPSPPLLGHSPGEGRSTLQNTSNLFQYNGSGSGPALGSTPAEEDHFFFIKSSLLETAEVRGGGGEGDDSESEDQEYITGGMHRRVRSCPVLPSVFFLSTALDFASLSTSATGTAVGSPVGLTAAARLAADSVGSGGNLFELVSSPKLERHHSHRGITTESVNAFPTFRDDSGHSSSKTNGRFSNAERNLMAEHLRQERKTQLYRALRLSELHSSITATSGSAVGGAITGISQSSHTPSTIGGGGGGGTKGSHTPSTIGGGGGGNTMPYLTESQLRDTFYSDLPTSSPNDNALRGFQPQPTQTTQQQQQCSSVNSHNQSPVVRDEDNDNGGDSPAPTTATAAPTVSGAASLTSHPSMGIPGGGSSSSTTTSPAGGATTSGAARRGSPQNSLTTPPRFHLASTTSAVSAKNLSRGTSPSSSSGTRPGDDVIPHDHRRSPENAFHRYSGNSSSSQFHSKSLTSAPHDEEASTSAKRRRIEERAEPLYRRLGIAHVKILMNFLFFWVTLLVVGALRVLLDVDARKLPLPQRLRNFLERQLAPPFEEEGDSLGVGSMNAADVSLSSFPAGHHVRTASTVSSTVLGAAPSKLRRRGGGSHVANSSQSSSSFGILTTKAGTRRESPADFGSVSTPRIPQPQTSSSEYGAPGLSSSSGTLSNSKHQLPTPLSCLKLGRVMGTSSTEAAANDDKDAAVVSPAHDNDSCASTPEMASVPPGATPDKKRITAVQWSPDHQLASIPPPLLDVAAQQVRVGATTATTAMSVDMRSEKDVGVHRYDGLDTPPPLGGTATTAMSVDMRSEKDVGVHRYDGLDTPPPLGGTLPPNLHGHPSPPAWLQQSNNTSDAGAFSTTSTTSLEAESGASQHIFERRARELGMRAVASHHENIDDMLDDNFDEE